MGVLGKVWARTGRRVEVAVLERRAARDQGAAVRAERLADLSRSAWYAASEGLPQTAEQRRAMYKGR